MKRLKYKYYTLYTMVNGETTIKLKKSTVKRLVELKTYNQKQESYDDVINRLIDFFSK